MESNCQCCCVTQELWWWFPCNRHAEYLFTAALWQICSFGLCTTQSLSVFVAELLWVPCQGFVHRYSMMPVLNWAEFKAKGAHELTDSFRQWKRPIDERTQHSVAARTMFRAKRWLSSCVKPSSCADTMTPMMGSVWQLCPLSHCNFSISISAVPLSFDLDVAFHDHSANAVWVYR